MGHCTVQVGKGEITSIAKKYRARWAGAAGGAVQAQVKSTELQVGIQIQALYRVAAQVREGAAAKAPKKLDPGFAGVQVQPGVQHGNIKVVGGQQQIGTVKAHRQIAVGVCDHEVTAACKLTIGVIAGQAGPDNLAGIAIIIHVTSIPGPGLDFQHQVCAQAGEGGAIQVAIGVAAAWVEVNIAVHVAQGVNQSPVLVPDFVVARVTGDAVIQVFTITVDIIPYCDATGIGTQVAITHQQCQATGAVQGHIHQCAAIAAATGVTQPQPAKPGRSFTAGQRVQGNIGEVEGRDSTVQ